MKNKGLSDYTIRFTDKALTRISQHANLNNPLEVEYFISTLQTSNGYKRNLCIAYNKYAKYYKIQWDMPLYKTEGKSIKIPTKEKLEMLIANSGSTLAIKLSIAKETGLRPVELLNLKVKDIDLDQRIIYPTTAKHGNARKLKISHNLTRMLQEYIIRNNRNPNDKIFKGTPDSYGENYRTMRNRLAKKLQDPTLRNIRLYDFRHFYATMLYAKTRDILLVKNNMGHKKIETTLIYTQLLEYNEEEWTCRTATNVTQATELIENGFTYVTEIDGTKLFRKRK